MKNRPKIGLVLGTGAARGIAHIGVLKALEEHHIPVDCISGCSMGALIGAVYASGIPVAKMEDLVLSLNIKKLVSLFRPSFTTSGIVQGEKIEGLLLAIMGDKQFTDLKIPLAITATDINTGKEVILTADSVIKAIRASIALPGIFVPVEINQNYLIDGGLVNPLPVSLTRTMGADINIIVNVMKNAGDYAQHVQYKKYKKIEKIKRFKNKLFGRENKLKQRLKSLFSDEKEKQPSGREQTADLQETKMYWTPNIINIILQSLYIMEAQLADLRLTHYPNEIIIKPDLSHIYMLEFHKASELIEAGYRATQKIVPVIEEKIKQWELISEK